MAGAIDVAARAAGLNVLLQVSIYTQNHTRLVA